MPWFSDFFRETQIQSLIIHFLDAYGYSLKEQDRKGFCYGVTSVVNKAWLTGSQSDLRRRIELMSQYSAKNFKERADQIDEKIKAGERSLSLDERLIHSTSYFLEEVYFYQRHQSVFLDQYKSELVDSTRLDALGGAEKSNVFTHVLTQAELSEFFRAIQAAYQGNRAALSVNINLPMHAVSVYYLPSSGDKFFYYDANDDASDFGKAYTADELSAKIKLWFVALTQARGNSPFIVFSSQFVGRKSDGPDITRFIESWHRSEAIQRMSKISKEKLDFVKPTGSALFLASASGDPEGAVAWIKAGVDPNIKTPDGYNAVHSAVDCHRADVVTALLENGVDANAPVSRGNKGYYNSLHMAVVNEDIGTVEALLPRDNQGKLLPYAADANALDSDGMTPIYLAITRDSLPVFNHLISAGADVNWLYKNRTPLIHAVQKSAIYTEALLQAGANPDLGDTGTGRSPLHTAVLEGRLDVVGILLTYGADINAVAKDGSRPLYIAVLKNDLNMVKFLLGKNAEINFVVDGNTPLLAAAIQSSDEIINLLITAGANVSAVAPNNFSLIHLAVGRNDPEILKSVLSACPQCDVNAETNSGLTPLRIAAQKGSPGTIALLVNAGADVNKASSTNAITPLHMAACNPTDENAKSLIAHGADLNAIGFAGYTPFHLAAELSSSPQVIDYFLSLLSAHQINVQNNDGFTPFHLAVKHGNVEVVKSFLANSKVNVIALTAQGESIYDLAVEIKASKELMKALSSDQRIKNAWHQSCTVSRKKRAANGRKCWDGADGETVSDQHVETQKRIAKGLPEELVSESVKTQLVPQNDNALTTAKTLDQYEQEQKKKRERVTAEINRLESGPLTQGQRIKAQSLKTARQFSSWSSNVQLAYLGVQFSKGVMAGQWLESVRGAAVFIGTEFAEELGEKVIKKAASHVASKALKVGLKGMGPGAVNGLFEVWDWYWFVVELRKLNDILNNPESAEWEKESAQTKIWQESVGRGLKTSAAICMLFGPIGMAAGTLINLSAIISDLVIAHRAAWAAISMARSRAGWLTADEESAIYRNALLGSINLPKSLENAILVRQAYTSWVQQIVNGFSLAFDGVVVELDVFGTFAQEVATGQRKRSAYCDTFSEPSGACCEQRSSYETRWVPWDQAKYFYDHSGLVSMKPSISCAKSFGEGVSIPNFVDYVANGHDSQNRTALPSVARIQMGSSIQQPPSRLLNVEGTGVRLFCGSTGQVVPSVLFDYATSRVHCPIDSAYSVCREGSPLLSKFLFLTPLPFSRQISRQISVAASDNACYQTIGIDFNRQRQRTRKILYRGVDIVETASDDDNVIVVDESTQSVKGGSEQDLILVHSVNLNALPSLDGGAGDDDTLQMTPGAVGSMPALLQKTKGIENYIGVSQAETIIPSSDVKRVDGRGGGDSIQLTNQPVDVQLYDGDSLIAGMDGHTIRLSESGKTVNIRLRTHSVREEASGQAQEATSNKIVLPWRLQEIEQITWRKSTGQLVLTASNQRTVLIEGYQPNKSNLEFYVKEGKLSLAVPLEALEEDMSQEKPLEETSTQDSVLSTEAFRQTASSTSGSPDEGDLFPVTEWTLDVLPAYIKSLGDDRSWIRFNDIQSSNPEVELMKRVQGGAEPNGVTFLFIQEGKNNHRINNVPLSDLKLARDTRLDLGKGADIVLIDASRSFTLYLNEEESIKTLDLRPLEKKLASERSGAKQLLTIREDSRFLPDYSTAEDLKFNVYRQNYYLFSITLKRGKILWRSVCFRQSDGAYTRLEKQGKFFTLRSYQEQPIMPLLPGVPIVIQKSTTTPEASYALNKPLLWYIPQITDPESLVAMKCQANEQDLCLYHKETGGLIVIEGGLNPESVGNSRFSYITDPPSFTQYLSETATTNPPTTESTTTLPEFKSESKRLGVPVHSVNLSAEQMRQLPAVADVVGGLALVKAITELDDKVSIFNLEDQINNESITKIDLFFPESLSDYVSFRLPVDPSRVRLLSKNSYQKTIEISRLNGKPSLQVVIHCFFECDKKRLQILTNRKEERECEASHRGDCVILPERSQGDQQLLERYQREQQAKAVEAGVKLPRVKGLADVTTGQPLANFITIEAGAESERQTLRTVRVELPQDCAHVGYFMRLPLDNIKTDSARGEGTDWKVTIIGQRRESDRVQEVTTEIIFTNFEGFSGLVQLATQDLQGSVEQYRFDTIKNKDYPRAERLMLAPKELDLGACNNDHYFFRSDELAAWYYAGFRVGGQARLRTYRLGSDTLLLELQDSVSGKRRTVAIAGYFDSPGAALRWGSVTLSRNRAEHALYDASVMEHYPIEKLDERRLGLTTARLDSQRQAVLVVADKDLPDIRSMRFLLDRDGVLTLQTVYSTRRQGRLEVKLQVDPDAYQDLEAINEQKMPLLYLALGGSVIHVDASKLNETNQALKEAFFSASTALPDQDRVRLACLSGNTTRLENTDERQERTKRELKARVESPAASSGASRSHGWWLSVAGTIIGLRNTAHQFYKQVISADFSWPSSHSAVGATEPPVVEPPEDQAREDEPSSTRRGVNSPTINETLLLATVFNNMFFKTQQVQTSEQPLDHDKLQGGAMESVYQMEEAFLASFGRKLGSTTVEGLERCVKSALAGNVPLSKAVAELRVLIQREEFESKGSRGMRWKPAKMDGLILAFRRSLEFAYNKLHNIQPEEQPAPPPSDFYHRPRGRRAASLAATQVPVVADNQPRLARS